MLINASKTGTELIIDQSNQSLKPKRKYTKGPKWLAYLKRKNHKKKHAAKQNKKHKYLTLTQSQRRYIENLGYGMHHIQNNKTGYREIWENIKKPNDGCLKFKNGFLKFKVECAPSLKGLNA